MFPAPNLKSLLFTCFVFIFAGNSFAQDFHFSQFYNAPLVNNPANTGVFLGEVRGATNYRKQWSTVSGFGADYTTMAASVDGNFFKRKSKRGNFAGLGGMFFSDKAGDSRMGVSSFNLTGAYILSLSPIQDRFLSMGFNAGYNQKSVSASGLKWDNQWTGERFDEGLPGEEVGKPSFIYMDFSLGAMYFYTGNRFRKYHGGMTISHFTKPNVSFYGREPYKIKYMVHGGGSFSNSSTNKVLQPAFYATKQGRHLELTAGTFWRYVMHEGSIRTGFTDERAVSFGAFYRFKDAIIAAIKYEFKNFNVGISYDINLSTLSSATKSFGGPEISIIYTSTPVKTRKAGQYKNVRYL